MSDLVKFNNGLISVCSKEIADNFGKTHRDVTRAISLMDCSQEFRGANFAHSFYTSEQNKKLKCFDITRDGFSFLCMGFTGKKAGQWKEAYISAFNSMEKHINNSGSLMDKINSAISIMEHDKAIASACSKGLNEWKKLKAVHKTEVDRLISESQLVLGF